MPQGVHFTWKVSCFFKKCTPFGLCHSTNTSGTKYETMFLSCNILYIYALMIHLMCLLCNSSYLRIFSRLIYIRIYIHTCAYTCMLYATCVYCHRRNIKKSKNLIRKLIIIHKTFPLPNTHIHMYVHKGVHTYTQCEYTYYLQFVRPLATLL